MSTTKDHNGKNQKHRCRFVHHRAGLLLLLSGMLVCLACYAILTSFSTGLPPFLPPAGRELNRSATSFRMAAFSDFAANVESMEEIAHSIGTQADFAVCLGDMMKSARETEYGHVVSEFREVMRVPLWAIPGNHDVEPMNAILSYHRFFGQDYYYWSYGDTLFIALNTAAGSLPEEQRLFLAQTLASQRNRYRRCVILCHVPPLNLQPHGSRCLPADDAAAFRRIVADYNIDLILSGHIHQFMEGSFAGIRLAHLPSSGQTIRDPKNGMFGYAMLDFSADGSIAIRQVNVTADTGREKIEFFASSFLGGRSILFLLGMLLLVGGIWLFHQHLADSPRHSLPDADASFPSPSVPAGHPPAPLSLPPKKHGLAHLWHASCYTASGLATVVGETAFRHEILAGCLLVPAAWLLPLPIWQTWMLSLLWTAVLVVEILNTAIEAIVDMVSPEYHPLAKKAKDIGSAAVGLCLAINLLAWAWVIQKLILRGE